MSDLGSDKISNMENFFADSGTLDPHKPSYVTRPADQELLNHVLKGEICYVLTARQMGKSSLMMRTASILKAQGIRSAIVDLTVIGTVPIEQWYRGLLTPIKNDLKLQVDVSAWWREHQDLGAPQRFFEFLHDVLLNEIKTSVVIFIDEIDTILSLDFRDDFFATIRAVYNARANDNVFNRITFVLLGVATPNELMRDQKRTPFNVGQRIKLQDFSYDDATPLRLGLDNVHRGQSEIILRRIFYWTNGHPYLTHKLCLAAARQPFTHWNDQEVDSLVHTNFLAEDARSDSNLKFVQDSIQAAPLSERRQLLDLYERVHRGEIILNNDRSISQNYLELVGLLRVNDKKLEVSNRIYHVVFDPPWVSGILLNKKGQGIRDQIDLWRPQDPPKPAPARSRPRTLVVISFLFVIVLALLLFVLLIRIGTR